jgi:hypothetical protein
MVDWLVDVVLGNELEMVPQHIRWYTIVYRPALLK